MKRIAFTILVGICLVGTIRAEPDSLLSERITEFEGWLDSAIETGEFVGITVAFEVDGYQWSRGYGLADRENQLPATDESSYRLASVSKSLTAVGVLKLVEAGTISLDDEVQVYVPDFPRKKWPVTIRHLLRHTSGISHYKDYRAEAVHTRQMSTEEALAIFQDWDLDFEPGTRMGYTTYGFNLLGAVIEGASGRPFCDYMAEEVWRPLGMTETYCDNPGDPIPNRVKGYVRREGEIAPSTVVNTSMKYGGGGMRSIAPDMVRFAQGVSDGKVLAKPWVDSMWMSGVTTDGHFTRYGYGWSTTHFNGHFLVMHGGAQEETRTTLLHLPGDDVTVVALSNFENSNPREPAMRLMAAILDEDYRTPQPYTGDHRDDIRFAALRWCFIDGFSYFDRVGRPMTMADDELTLAFAYVRTLLDEDTGELNLDSLRTLLDEGRHPVAGQPFTRAGSFMAAMLKRKMGSAYIDSAYGRGELAAASDYCELAAKSFNLERLDPDVEKIVLAWNKAWIRSWNDDVRALHFSSHMDIDEARVTMRRAVQNQPIYPYLMEDIEDACLVSAHEGKDKQALQLAQMGIDLYPQSDLANATMGLLQIMRGDQAQGRVYFDRAFAWDADGAVGSDGLNSMAYRLAGQGDHMQAIDLLTVAIELHPTVANLYDSKAEMYMNSGDLTKARQWYQKALEVDPDFESPRRMLERIDELEAEKAGGGP